MAMNTLPPEIMFDGPIPGESLASSPDAPKPYERPPEFTNYDKAVKFLFETLLERGEELTDLMEQSLPVEVLASQILFQGFRTGKWNPDLLITLIEPTIYILLFLCEQAGTDYTMSIDDAEHADTESELKARAHIDKLAKQVDTTKPPSEVLPTSLLGGM